MKRILLVEDEENFGSLLKNYLELSNYQVDWRKTGTEGYSAFKSKKYDLCILDIMMPHMDGFTLAEKIRENSNLIPLFFLTAKNTKEDQLKGYNIGADDYLTKPFDTEILLHKIRIILDRKNREMTKLVSKDIYKFGKFEFNPKQRLLSFDSKANVKLSPKESMLLELLCQHKDSIMPTDTALESIWGEVNYFTKRSMDVYITKLRKHLGDDKRIAIETIHQVGYQLMVNSVQD